MSAGLRTTCMANPGTRAILASAVSASPQGVVHRRLGAHRGRRPAWSGTAVMLLRPPSVRSRASGLGWGTPRPPGLPPPPNPCRTGASPCIYPTGVARSTGQAHPPTAQTPPSLPRRIRPQCTPAGSGHRLARRLTRRRASNLSCCSRPNRTLNSPIARLPVGHAYRPDLSNRSMRRLERLLLVP
jgi:hypothetical protein